jgi:uncharacterized protein
LLALFGTKVQAQALQAVPLLSARVIDQTGVLDESARQQIATALAQLEAQRGSQMVVLVVPTTQPEDIAAYAWRVADSWKIGRREVGDGVLLVVALQDRKMRLEVARALEGAIPDLMAKRVIDEVLKPAFVQGQFGAGLLASVQAVDQLIAGEELPPPTPQVNESADTQGLLFALFGAVLFGRGLASMLGRIWGGLAAFGLMFALGWSIGNRWWLGAIAGAVGLLAAWAPARASSQTLGGPLSGHSGWSGQGSSGGFGARRGGFSSGSGMRSGGGGSFGGGGASGGW